jgi:hypothetical protein
MWKGERENYTDMQKTKQEEVRLELIEAARPLCNWMRKYGGDFAYVTDDFVKVSFNLTSAMVPRDYPLEEENGRGIKR